MNLSNTKKNRFTKYYIGIGLFLLTYLFVLIFRQSPDLTEKLYSTGIYPYISMVLRFIFGWIPFSIGDIFYTIIGGIIFLFFIKKFKSIWQNPVYFFGKIVLFVGGIFFIFHLFWGFNYYRKPLEKTLKLNTIYTESELYNATKIFVQRANELHTQLMPIDTLSVDIPLTNQEIYKLTSQGYENVSYKFPQFKLCVNSLKSSLYSRVLTYMGYSGYLNPFTGEAQVNRLPVGYHVPITATHEVAHQLGYSAENEANFIAYLVSTHHQNKYFKYSATLFALRYCLGEVQKVNQEKYDKFLSKIRKGILKNYKESSDFWKQYQNPLEPYFKASYDVFLKANNQKKGIQSYNYVTGMIINYELQN